MSSFEKKQLLTNSLVVESKNILNKKNINSYLKYILKKKYERKCNNNGYIIPESLEIIQRSIGKITTIDGKSYIKYEITYEIKTIIPCVGDVFKCIINSNTKMGLIGYLDYNDNKEIEKSPILFIIPREFLDEKKNYKVDSKINVKVLDVRTKFMSDQIQIIAEEFK